ncbi:MAG: type VI secretion system tip protein TssI/VgrG [Pseudomonadota bacterium]|nr:type VI secretion system tip protein TssI/VgrG [Pseudomonadota bacterium]
MSSPANHSRFALQIPALDDEVRVVSFQYQGALSTPFECWLDVACERRDLPLEDLLGKSGVLTLFDARHPRHIHGELVQLAQGAIGKRFTSYRMLLRPKISLLGLRSGMRIFQDKTARQIITQVLKDVGITDQQVRWQIQSPPLQREYCVQYRETDLDFVQRLLVEEGLFYHFEHSLSGHVLVIADTNSVFQPMPGRAVLPYRGRSGLVSGEESIYEFHSQQQLQSGAVTLRDYGFQKPANRLEGSASASDFDELQHYRYPGRFQSPAQGRAFGQAQLQGHQAQRASVTLESDCVRLAVGRRFSLSQHGTQAFNQEYVVTSLQVEGRQPQVLEEGASEEGSHFGVRAQAIPAKTPYRPSLTRQNPTQQRPRISGVQTAFVTGPKGEEIYTDQHGRIKVQFHWDREGKRNENSSCWLRLSQAWAGNQWGAQALPRIGQEVIVSFLNGDPDRPLVTGALYNATTQPPYNLPANKTRTTLKTQSSPGAGGYNELRLEDKKGSEQIFIHGQKDVDLYVKNDRMDSIDHDRHRIVIAAAKEKVGQDYSNKTGANRNLKIGQTLSQTVGGSVQQKAGQNWLQQVGNECSMKAGTSVVLDAGMSVTLKAGGGTIVLNPAGVAITGTMVRINSGGGAGSAKSASPTAPQPPKAVDPGNPGASMPALGASARFKQQPVEFDDSKGRVLDASAVKTLEKTFVHGSASAAPSKSHSSSNQANNIPSMAPAVTALAASLARVQQGEADPAGKVFSPERVEQLLSGRGIGGQMSRHNGARNEAAQLRELGVGSDDTLVDLSGLTRDQKLDTVFGQTGYFISDETAEALTHNIDSGAQQMVISDAVAEGEANARAYIQDHPAVKAYTDNLESAIADPEGSAYGGGPGLVAGLSEGARQANNILTVNNAKMPAALKDAALDELLLDAGGVVLSGAPVVGAVRGVGRGVPNTKVLTKAERLEIQQALQTRVDDIRVGLPKKLRGSGNVGVAQLDIPGLPTELKAHSRINYPTDKDADGFVHLADESDWIFKPKAVDPDNVRVGTPDAYTRQWDTEFKILNDVALRLGNNRNAAGSINLFTERLTCTSCTDVIFDFKDRYPNIQLNVFAGE